MSQDIYRNCLVLKTRPRIQLLLYIFLYFTNISKVTGAIEMIDESSCNLENEMREREREEGEEKERQVTHNRRVERRTQNAAAEAEIEGHTRSLWPSSIRIPRISVNGPLLPRPFGQCTVWVVDMSPQIPHILRRMGRWCCRAQPTGIRLVTATRYGPRRCAFLSLSSPSVPIALSLPPPYLSPSAAVESSTLATGTTRMAAVSLPTALCIYRYLFTCSRRSNDSCSSR